MLYHASTTGSSTRQPLHLRLSPRPTAAEERREIAAPQANEPRWRNRTLALIAGLLAFRTVYLALFPVDLVADEAYYWDWSRQLDWGYFSKPPLIAWLMAAATAIGGPTVFALRLPAVLLGTLGLAIVYLLAARMFDRRVGFWSVAISAATPGNSAMSLLMTIDAPFLFFWSAAIYALWRMLERRPDRSAWLAAAILFTGLGLLSKQTTVAAFPLVFLFLAAGREDRRELLRPAIWLWVAASLAFLTPVLWWNSQHGWLTLQHTSTHFSRPSSSWLRQLAVSGEFLAAQAGVASPLTWFMLVAVAIASLWSLQRMNRAERFLWCLSILPLGGVVLLSLKQRVEPNWPAAFYLTGMILVTAWALGRSSVGPAWPQREKLFRFSVAGGAALCLATYLLPWFLTGFGLAGGRFDPLVRLRGWRELALHTAAARDALPRPHQTLIVLTTGRGPVGELAFYLPDHPRVYCWHPGDHFDSQYDVWGGPADKPGWDALLLSAVGEQVPAPLAAAFDRLEPCGEIHVPIGSAREHAFALWRGVSLRAWPGNNLTATTASTAPAAQRR